MAVHSARAPIDGVRPAPLEASEIARLTAPHPVALGPTGVAGDASVAEHQPLAVHMTAGHAMLASGAALAALRCFDAAVAADPGAGDAWAARGDALVDLARFVDAAEAFARAAALDPACVEYQRRRAAALAAAGLGGEARAAWQAIHAARPDCTRTLAALASLYAEDNRLADAERCHRELATLGAADAEAMTAHGVVLMALGDHPRAVQVLQGCLRRWPDHAPARFHLGVAWATLAERDKATASWRAYLDLAPGDPLDARGRLAALAEDRLDPVYVRHLFDQYAPGFDQALVGRLGYRGPDLVAAELAAGAGAPQAALDILDLGCGTGLAGVALAPWARRLDGVDLSQAMLDEAAAKGIYDRLERNNAVAALEAAPRAWDVIVAADVLVYMGELSDLLAGVAAALRPGGLFIATAERPDETVSTFALKPTRRFGHGEAYLRGAATAAGLDVVRLAPCTPRLERRLAVDGWIFTMALARGGR